MPEQITPDQQQPINPEPSIPLQQSTTQGVSQPLTQPVSQPLTQPQQPLSPLPQQPQVSQPVHVANQNNEIPKDKSNKLLFVLLGIGAFLIVLIAVLAALYIFIFSASAQSKKASTLFMDAATSANIEKLVELNDGKDRGFLEGVVKSVEGNYSLLERGDEDSKYYFLYELKDANAKYARTTVENEEDGWGVTSIVFGEQELKLIPSGSPVADQEPTITSAQPTALACLEQEDYRFMNIGEIKDQNVTYDSNYIANTTPGSGTFNKTGSILFDADMTTTSDDESDTYDQWAKFAKLASDKDWKFRLAGSTYDSGTFDQAAVDLANNRAKAVKDELTKRGVPDSKISIDAPEGRKYVGESSDDQYTNALYRRVNLVVDPTCKGAAQADSSSGR